MASDFEMREDAAGLHFRVRKGPEAWIVPVEIFVGGIVVYFLQHSAGLHPVIALIVTVLCVFQVVKDAMARIRGTDVELVVTDDGFVSAGHAPGGYEPCSIARVDVSNMLFREGASGDEEQRPQGLYIERYDASTWSMGDCLLPAIDAEQAERVIKEILRRFPDTEYVGSGQMSKGGLTLLNLHGPDRTTDSLRE